MVDFKVLIVENDDTMRELMESSLGESFNVKAVKGGKEALSVMNSFGASLVLIDFQIEDMSSVAVQQEIMKMYPEVHTAMISNIDRSRMSLDSMKKRAMDYIYRSEDTERFLSDVCKLVRYIIDTRYQIPHHREVVASGFYDLAKRLYEEKRWTVEDIERKLKEGEKG